MAAKSPEKTFYHRSPILCCNCIVSAFYTPLLRSVLLTAIIILLVAAVIFVICGAVYTQSHAAYYVVSFVFFLVAVILLSLYIWANRRSCLQTIGCQHMVNRQQTEVPTISRGLDYYSQMPPGKSTDFPMGPHLTMTLPRPKRARTRPGTEHTDESPQPIKKNLLRAKNLPPLASEETLSPSLDGSSCASIGSVV